MATMNELATRLLQKFKNVPNVTIEDAEEWMQEALERHGVKNGDPKYLPKNEVYLVIILGQAEGARRIALDTGHFFRYQDGDEMVDKTTVSEHWLRMANSFETDYRRQLSLKVHAAKFRVAKRLDRK